MLMRMLAIATGVAGGVLLARTWSRSRGHTAATKAVLEKIEVSLPVRTVYDQWTQFEQFPKFMESVHEVRQLDDRRLHWEADVFGRRIEWDAEITEQTPDQKIAWRSTSGKRNDGMVTFRALTPTRTKVSVTLSFEPDGAIETMGEAVGAVRAELRDNLQRFKEQLEASGRETGGWRGVIGGDTEQQNRADH